MKSNTYRILNILKLSLINEDDILFKYYLEQIRDSGYRIEYQELIGLKKKLIEELRVRNYFNCLELIDDYLFENFNSSQIETKIGAIKMNVVCIYGITINIFKNIINHKDEFTFSELKGSDLLIHYFDQKKISITIHKAFHDEFKSEEMIYFNVFLKKQSSVSAEVNFHISRYENERNYFNYITQIEHDKKVSDALNYSRISRKEYESDYFGAMTDGQLGNYDDYIENGGSIDDIEIWTGN